MNSRESKEYHVTLHVVLLGTACYSLLQHVTVFYGLLHCGTACYIVVLLVTLRYCFLSLVTVGYGLLQCGKPQKIDFAQTLSFGRVINPKNCYAIGFFKYCVISGKNANFGSEPNFG